MYRAWELLSRKDNELGFRVVLRNRTRTYQPGLLEEAPCVPPPKQDRPLKLVRSRHLLLNRLRFSAGLSPLPSRSGVPGRCAALPLRALLWWEASRSLTQHQPCKKEKKRYTRSKLNTFPKPSLRGIASRHFRLGFLQNQPIWRRSADEAPSVKCGRTLANDARKHGFETPPEAPPPSSSPR